MSLQLIIHLDMDAFYPSVETLDHPEINGKPVIVGGSLERGVVSSASYEARKFGVHSAQPMAVARRLCPTGIFLPIRMKRYQEVSKTIFEIFHLITPLVEPLSIDEAFLDVSGSTRLFGSPEQIAQKIKRMVLKETGLTVSAGIAPSKFVAKIASDMDKPDGLTVVSPDEVRAFLNPLPVEKMWGVGKVTQAVLRRMNIHTFKELSQVPIHVLERKFGSFGLKMHQLSMGVDDRKVTPHRDAKSIGHEITFSRDILDLDEAKKALLSLANRVAGRVREKGILGKTITLKVKYADFSQITRSITLRHFTNDGPGIYSNVLLLLPSTAVGEKPIRLLGIALSQFDAGISQKQIELFREEAPSPRKKRLNAALDSLYRKHGEKSVIPGVLLDKDELDF